MFFSILLPTLKMFHPFQTLLIKLHWVYQDEFAIYTQQDTAMSLYCTLEIKVKCMPEKNDNHKLKTHK